MAKIAAAIHTFHLTLSSEHGVHFGLCFMNPQEEKILDSPLRDPDMFDYIVISSFYQRVICLSLLEIESALETINDLYL